MRISEAQRTAQTKQKMQSVPMDTSWARMSMSMRKANSPAVTPVTAFAKGREAAKRHEHTGGCSWQQGVALCVKMPFPAGDGRSGKIASTRERNAAHQAGR